jgi:hypothetical protein
MEGVKLAWVVQCEGIDNGFRKTRGIHKPEININILLLKQAGLGPKVQWGVPLFMRTSTAI